MSVPFRPKDAKIRAAYSWLKATANLSSPKQSLSSFRAERRKVIKDRAENEAAFIRQQFLHVIAASKIPSSKALLQKENETHMFEVRWPIPPKEYYDSSMLRSEIRDLHKSINASHFGLLIGYFYHEESVGLHFFGKFFHMENVEESTEANLREQDGRDIVWMQEDTSQAWLADAWISIDAKAKVEVVYLVSIDETNLTRPNWKPVVKSANDVMMKHQFKYHMQNFHCKTFVDDLVCKLTRRKLVNSSGLKVERRDSTQSYATNTTTRRRSERIRKNTSRFTPYNLSR